MIVFYASCPEFQREAKARVKLDDWNPILEISERMLWAAITRALASGLGQVSSLAVKSEMEKLSGGDVVLSHARTIEILGYIDNIPAESLKGEYGLKIVLQPFLDERHVRRALDQLDDSAGIAELEHIVNTVAKENKIVSFSPRLPLDPDKGPQGSAFKFKKFNIDWLDDLLGGGIGISDVLLFLGPSGGGKTVFGLQVAKARALMQEYVDYYLYEQALDGDINERIWAMATGQDRSAFKNKGASDLTPEQDAAIRASSKAYGKYMRFYELSQPLNLNGLGTNGASDIWNICEQEKRNNAFPSLIVIDWVGSAVRRQMASSNLSADNLGLMRHYLSAFVQSMAELANTYCVQIVLLHQVATTKAQSEKSEITYSDSSECKGMAEYLRYALGVAKADKKGHTRMHLSKGTSTKVGRTVNLTLDGAHNIFIPRKDTTYDETSRQYINNDELVTTGTMPLSTTVER